jgi:transposase
MRALPSRWESDATPQTVLPAGVTTGKTAGQVARELDLTETAVRQWIRQADLDAGRRSDGLTTVERDELRRLRRENRDLREEREILRKAAVFFARETGHR